MAIKDSPDDSLFRRFQGPISFLTLVVGALSFVLSYILVTLGVTLYFDLHGFGDQITAVDSLIIVAMGFGFAVVGYFGYKLFLRVAY